MAIEHLRDFLVKALDCNRLHLGEQIRGELVPVTRELADEAGDGAERDIVGELARMRSRYELGDDYCMPIAIHLAVRGCSSLFDLASNVVEVPLRRVVAAAAQPGLLQLLNLVLLLAPIVMFI